MTELSEDERRRALEAATEARLLMPCPHHPDVFVLVGDADEAKRPDLPVGVDEILRTAPSYCPKCADEDE